MRTPDVNVLLYAVQNRTWKHGPRDHWRIASCSNCTGNTSTSSASA